MRNPEVGDAAVPVILVTGPTGVGKSQVVAELSRMIDQHGIKHSRLDWDTLTNGIAGDAESVLAVLASVWKVHRTAGAERLLLAASLERPRMLTDISTAIEGAALRAFYLSAPPDEIAARLRHREGGGLSQHIFIGDIAADMRSYDTLRDVLERVDTAGRTATDVATELLRRSGWKELSGP